ncbi:MAG: hypothetical protein DRP82_00345 [Planctomycetota bacterium]|nr:MAG: hypothetical protein DRP82_00345 [Planctomycetota bacterium]
MISKPAQKVDVLLNALTTDWKGSDEMFQSGQTVSGMYGLLKSVPAARIVKKPMRFTLRGDSCPDGDILSAASHVFL